MIIQSMEYPRKVSPSKLPFDIDLFILTLLYINVDGVILIYKPVTNSNCFPRVT